MATFWTIRPGDSVGSPADVFVMEGDRIVAEVSGHHPTDARLIRAAPDLYAALRTIASQGGADITEPWAAGIASDALAKVEE